MELKHYAAVLWKWSWLIVLAVLFAGGASYWATKQQPRIYLTSTTLMVGRFIQSADPSQQDFWTSQQLAQSYVQLARRKPILEAAIDALGIEMYWQELAGKMNANVVQGTQLILISVADTDPIRAEQLTNEIARQLILQSPTTPEKEQEQHRQFVNDQLTTLQSNIQSTEQELAELQRQLALETSARSIQDTQGQIAALQQKLAGWQTTYASLLDFYNGSRTNFLSVVEPAFPAYQVGPNTRSNVMLAVSIAAMLAVSAAFLLEYLDDTVKSRDDVDRALALPTLGTINRIGRIREPTDHLIAMNAPRAPVSEAYRVLRTNIQFSSLNSRPLRLLITSAGPNEGKTTTATNLAIIMAQAGMRVILVDTDLRRPSIHSFFNVLNHVGLTTLLIDDGAAMETALHTTRVPGLSVLTSGPLPPNPAEMLGSEQMRARVTEMQALADVIIFDSPPVLAVADATILGALSSGVVLIINSGRTRSDSLRRTKERLEQVGLKILGVVLNKLSEGRAEGYDYYYYYSHESGGSGGGGAGSSGGGSAQRRPAPRPALGLFARLRAALRRQPSDREIAALQVRLEKEIRQTERPSHQAPVGGGDRLS